MMTLALSLHQWQVWAMSPAPSANTSAAAVAADDWQAIQAVLNGDGTRYERLVTKYQDGALAVALTLLGNYEDAKDVSQDAFVSAYQSLASFRGNAKFSTWLYRIVVNKCKDFYRNRARSPRGWLRVGSEQSDSSEEPFFVARIDVNQQPDAITKNRELAGKLSSAIRGLPLKQRTAFVLHHVQGLVIDEVAQIMNVSSGTVKSHIFRATEAIRLQMVPWMEEES